jgi:uncharacterized protein YcfL
MLRRHRVAALAVTLATFALTGCSSDNPVSSLNNLDAAPPSAPVNIRTEIRGGSVLLDWDASTEADVVGYDVYRYDPDPARESAYVKVNAATITDSEYLIPDASEQGTWYRVKAVDLSSNRSNSSGAAYAAMGVLEGSLPVATGEPSIERDGAR